jgi:formylglycine-generating enzyme required for sulfatase activity
MGRIEKTVFISYRRADEFSALAIFQNLTQHGYDVFIDYDGIASGRFWNVIFENIRARAHFLVLLTPTALGRCGDPNDWMRREIEAAIDSQRNIVPLMFAGFKFDTPAIASQLTAGKLVALQEYNGLEIPAASFFSSQMERLRNFLNVSVDAVLYPASASAQQAATEQKRKAVSVSSIKFEARIVHGAPDGWFLPGNGRAEWFKDHNDGPEMVVVPAGEFMMGSPKSEERPKHKVTIARPFAVGRFAVTFDEWDAARGERGVSHNARDEGWGRGRQPVINVSWDDANSYVAWLSEMSGKSYRLLSEAEWEYAARAGTTTGFWLGSSITPDQANYHCNEDYEGVSVRGRWRQSTVAVNSFEPNPWSLYGVHGNVWEWCEDTWHENYHGNPPLDGSPWLGADSDDRLRPRRGGSWDNRLRALRSANRSRVPASSGGNDTGFRVARTLTA